MYTHVRNRKAPPEGPFLRTLQRRVALGLLLASCLVGTTAAAGLPAFPGAEGAGSFAVGGRGGAVCKVNNLNDSGPGSLRECVDMTGPRTVIFEVGGTIKLDSTLHITNPYLTIAGQTAPGGGIQIKANKRAGSNVGTLLRVHTHDVIIRFLRLRPGQTGYRLSPANTRDASIGDGVVENVIWDHVSVSWAFDGTTWSLWGSSSTESPRNVTLQNSILAESRVNLLTGGNSAAVALASTNIDFHNNLLSSASHRNPLLKIASARFVNNIVYNWSSWASRTSSGVHADWISNYYKPGPDRKLTDKGLQEIMAVRYSPEMASAEKAIQRDPSLYIEGNRGILSGMDPNTDNWPYTREAGISENGSVVGPMPAEWRRYNPLPTVGVPITVRHADDLESHMLSIVGASRRLDCFGNWVSNRDATDARIIDDYRNNRGSVSVSHEQDVGGYPVLAAGVPCTDTSGDGIPDQWATANGLDPTDPSLGRRVHESGYTYLETYLNGVTLEAARPASPGRVIVE